MLSRAAEPAGWSHCTERYDAPAARHRTDKRPAVAAITACAIGFLAVAAFEAGPASTVAKAGWVTLTTAMGAVEPATGVALYLAGAAVYSPRHFSGWGSFNERPDNFAVAGLILAFAFSQMAARRRPRLDAAGVLAGSLLVYALAVSQVLGQLDRATFAALLRSLGIPLLLFVILAAGTRRLPDLVVPLGVLVALGVYIASVSILEAVGAHSLIRPAWIVDPAVNDWLESGRAGGPQMQPAFNGLALTLTAVLCVGFAWTGSAWRRALGSVAVVPMIAGIFVCYTRGPWLSALLAAGALSFAGGPGVRSRTTVVRLSIVALLAATIVAAPGRFARERAVDTETVRFRFNVWAAGLRMASERPLFGFGFAQFKAEVGSFRDSMDELSDRTRSVPGNVAHNQFLRVLVELGGVGLLLYGATLWLVMRDGFRGAQLVLGSRGTALVLALSVAYLFNGLFITLHEPFQNCLFFGPMGLLAGATRERAGG